MHLAVVPFLPGRRPTDEDRWPGFGSSDRAALVTDGRRPNTAVVLVETYDLPETASLEATITIDGRSAGRARVSAPHSAEARQRVVLHPDVDFAGVDLSLAAGFLRQAQVEVRAMDHGNLVAADTASLDVCDVRLLGSLYRRITDQLVEPDMVRQARAAGVADPGVAYHPWYPVLLIGGEKVANYVRALVADIVGKEDHLTDPVWLLRVGIYLELLTCLGVIEAVKDDVGDLLEPRERAALEESAHFADIRARIDPGAWRAVWERREVSFARFGTPRLGPVSGLNLLRKREATLQFLRTHHEDLKHAIELAGPNSFNAQETWQRVFRDAERAVLSVTAVGLPELRFLPAAAREAVLWRRRGPAAAHGVYPTACDQYRASMNEVADWAQRHGLMEHAGAECIPREVSLLWNLMASPARVAVLQRQDGLGPDVTIGEPVVTETPATREIEDLLSGVPIFRMLTRDQLHDLAEGARPLFFGPTQRFVVQGHRGTSLFVVAEGAIEVRRREPDGREWLVDTMGPG
ncbi:cyclic nucleotide-binding domain-containing protein [Nocardioides antri]|uniref:Cyclic nucleotide-binding domain-containing protein n=1 Tax=Nocardioides antri TaxID=2607659 RepID=A0A5B1MCW1_9ACTN|nr:cyclic nucleotide-binding domain-containing protein [Nocardioides antri]KAA1429420.1 cyclic nucleotide-binding domain-containing protein [Nocardioides antri]